jgi:hypothetical protein
MWTLVGYADNETIKEDTYQSNVFIKPFLHQLMSQSAVQKPSLKPKPQAMQV